MKPCVPRTHLFGTAGIYIYIHSVPQSVLWSEMDIVFRQLVQPQLQLPWTHNGEFYSARLLGHALVVLETWLNHAGGKRGSWNRCRGTFYETALEARIIYQQETQWVWLETDFRTWLKSPTLAAFRNAYIALGWGVLLEKTRSEWLLFSGYTSPLAAGCFTSYHKFPAIIHVDYVDGKLSIF